MKSIHKKLEKLLEYRDENGKPYRVAEMARMLKVSRGCVYYALSNGGRAIPKVERPSMTDDKKVARAIDSYLKQNPSVGLHHLTEHLKSLGIECSNHSVYQGVARLGWRKVWVKE